MPSVLCVAVILFRRTSLVFEGSNVGVYERDYRSSGCTIYGHFFGQPDK